MTDLIIPPLEEEPLSGFLKLPKEIRLRIYEMVLLPSPVSRVECCGNRVNLKWCSPGGRLLASTCKPTLSVVRTIACPTCEWRGGDVHTAIMQVNHHIHNETVAVLYENAQIVHREVGVSRLPRYGVPRSVSRIFFPSSLAIHSLTPDQQGDAHPTQHSKMRLATCSTFPLGPSHPRCRTFQRPRGWRSQHPARILVSFSSQKDLLLVNNPSALFTLPDLYIQPLLTFSRFECVLDCVAVIKRFLPNLKVFAIHIDVDLLDTHFTRLHSQAFWPLQNMTCKPELVVDVHIVRAWSQSPEVLDWGEEMVCRDENPKRALELDEVAAELRRQLIDDLQDIYRSLDKVLVVRES